MIEGSSLLTPVAFYLVARTRMRVFAATTAMAMLAGNLVFLHFSRTASENLNAPLFALGACYATERALRERRGRPWQVWWSISGLFIAFGLYGYLTGRFIFVAVTLIALVAVAFDKARWKPTLRGLAVAALVRAVVFLPMAMAILRDWDVFTRRPAVVSVLNVADGESYLGDSFFVLLFIAESFSTGTPDTARGVIIVPFYFLFIGLFLHV